MKPILDALSESLLTPEKPDPGPSCPDPAPPAPTPVPCCKCAAYREIISDQLREIERMRLMMGKAAQWTGYATDELLKINRTKP
jgi:hypothetical protein